MGKKTNQKNSFWSDIKYRFIDLLKDKFINLVLKAVFKTTIGGGIKVFVIKYVAKYLFDEIAIPLIEESFLLLGYTFEKIEGNITIKKLEKAKKDNDEQSYNDILINL